MADQLHRNSDHGALLTQTMRQTSESSREAGCFAMDTQMEDDFFGRRALSISDMDGSRKIDSPGDAPKHLDGPFCYDIRAASFVDYEQPQHIDANTPLIPSPSISAPISSGSDATVDPLLLQFLFCSPSHIPKDIKTSAYRTSGIYGSTDKGGLENQDELNSIGNEGWLRGLRYPFDNAATVKNVATVEAPIVTQSCITERAFVPSTCGEIFDISSPNAESENAHNEADFYSAPPEFDASPGSMHFFSQAGVHITTRELQNDFVAAQATSLGGDYLDIDQGFEDEKNRATSEFFANQPPSVIYESVKSAFTGTNNTVQETELYQRQQATGYLSSENLILARTDDLVDKDYYLGPDASGPYDTYGSLSAGIISKDHGAQPDEPVDDLLAQPRTPADLCFIGVQSVQPRISTLELPVKQELTYTKDKTKKTTLRISKAPVGAQHGIIRGKRKQRSDVGHHTHIKRARLNFHLKHSAEINASGQGLSPTSSVNTTVIESPMATALRGYTGQFHLYVCDKVVRMKESIISHTFGNRSHPNGLVTNPSFTLDVRHDKMDFTDFDINDDIELTTIVTHAEQSSFASALLEPLRTKDENAQRKEAHRECAAARLEGVSVGYFRYFLGHMTVEEYIGAKLCVCWEECFCNKLCTRFGDLLCPCSDKLRMEEE